jgi:signal transduction histidine kinase/CheY-like chemotaxis protein
MSNSADIHRRVFSAFVKKTAAGRPPVDRKASTDGACMRRFLAAGGRRKGAVARYRALRAWLGGGGLVVGALLFPVGYPFGPAILATLLTGIALTAAGCFLHRLFAKAAAVFPVLDAAPDESASFRNGQPAEDAGWSRVYDALGDVAVTWSIDRHVVRANDGFCRLTGRIEVEGLSCEELGLAIGKTAEPRRYDLEIATPEGQRTLDWRDAIIRDAASGELRIESVARDVTSERLAWRASENARLKAEYNSAAKSRLLATVSHEIRTPLSGILGMSDLLSQTRLTPEQANYLAGMRQSGKALVQLVEDLLDFSTIEVGRFELRPRPDSLRRLIEGVVEMLAHRAHEKGIEIGATVSADIPEIMSFDPARLRQVLFNVIGNAVKFTQIGGVLVRADIKGHELIISIRDTGPGMTPDEQARIFGEFEQAGSATDRSVGTGLGLAISARIVQKFGGSLGVVSEKGKGSLFTIGFPVVPDADGGRDTNRKGLLEESRVLLLAPDGAASAAVAGTIRALGGSCRLVEPEDAAGLTFDTIGDVNSMPTDIIVDHRMAPQFFREVSDWLSIAVPGVRKILLVNPEERSIRPLDIFDAWLIRPLREQSLIDVLSGRMRGAEVRDATNDNMPGPSAVPEGPQSDGLNIVLAEDDPINAILVRAVLTRAGHGVELFEDFESLLDRLRGRGGRGADLVVTDLSMPGGEGLDVIEQIRARELSHDLERLPVVVLTADDREEIRRGALLAGADLVLAKPVDPVRLLAEIQAVVTTSQRRAEAG